MEREALKLALEALENISEFAVGEGDVCEIIAKRARLAAKALEEALEQPAQKPVAWLQIGVGPLHEGDVLARTTKPKEWNPKWWKFEPLYTIPPQREWVGLTDDEIKEIHHLSFGKDIAIATGLTEAKLKEKNT